VEWLEYVLQVVEWEGFGRIEGKRLGISEAEGVVGKKF
jgi:hypothetical protein